MCLSLRILSTIPVTVDNCCERSFSKLKRTCVLLWPVVTVWFHYRSFMIFTIIKLRFVTDFSTNFKKYITLFKLCLISNKRNHCFSLCHKLIIMFILTCIDFSFVNYLIFKLFFQKCVTFYYCT